MEVNVPALTAPTTEEPAADQPETQTEPKRAKPRWRTQSPWPQGRTRIAAPLEDDRLTLDNETAMTWAIAVGYHALDPLGPFVKREERIVKSGMLSARPLEAIVGMEYLTTYLNPRVRSVKIRGQIVGNQPFYDLRLVENGRE